MDSILKPGITLFVIAAVAAGILGYINSITSGPIAEAEAKKTKASVLEVLPDAEDLEEAVSVDKDANSGVTSYIEAKDKSGNTVGYAISLEITGFSSGLKLMYGIDTEGTITGLSIIDCSNETPGLGANIKTNDEIRNQFNGREGGDLKVEKDGGDVKSLTGATITSRAVADAANSASNFFNTEIKNNERGA